VTLLLTAPPITVSLDTTPVIFQYWDALGLASPPTGRTGLLAAAQASPDILWVAVAGGLDMSGYQKVVSFISGKVATIDYNSYDLCGSRDVDEEGAYNSSA